MGKMYEYKEKQEAKDSEVTDCSCTWDWLVFPPTNSGAVSLTGLWIDSEKYPRESLHEPWLDAPQATSTNHGYSGVLVCFVDGIP